MTAPNPEHVTLAIATIKRIIHPDPLVINYHVGNIFLRGGLRGALSGEGSHVIRREVRLETRQPEE